MPDNVLYLTLRTQVDTPFPSAYNPFLPSLTSGSAYWASPSVPPRRCLTTLVIIRAALRTITPSGGTRWSL